ncbi:Golgi to ER traffic protein 4 homolog isoform X1 [Nomascus leucogenys]|nr:Golgi to ER traffic protein 4 homolog isoform X1 [Nomascus leucogenys]
MPLSLCSLRSSSFPCQRCSGSGDVMPGEHDAMEHPRPFPPVGGGVRHAEGQRAGTLAPWGKKLLSQPFLSPVGPHPRAPILRLLPVAAQLSGGHLHIPCSFRHTCPAQRPFWSQLLKPVSCSRVRLLSGSWCIWTQIGPSCPEAPHAALMVSRTPRIDPSMQHLGLGSDCPVLGEKCLCVWGAPTFRMPPVPGHLVFSFRPEVERGSAVVRACGHGSRSPLSGRYMSQSKHAEARELMYSGALLFFSHGQQNSAADLSMLVLESLEKAEVEVADELLENLAKVFSLMDPNSPERVAFVSRALKWSSGGSGKLGHPRLHQLLALTLWKEQNYCESRYHFLHSADGEGCANMLVEYSTSRGFRSEVDMFVAQAVLQFLCLKNKSSASVVFTTYTQKHPSIEDGPPFVEPLLNFIWFLLLAVDGGKLTVFTVLCEQYQPSLRRDPMYNEYLDRIGQLFFGVPPKQTSSYGGLLGNLLSSLMGSSEQEEGEESPSDGSPIELD